MFALRTAGSPGKRHSNEATANRLLRYDGLVAESIDTNEHPQVQGPLNELMKVRCCAMAHPTTRIALGKNVRSRFPNSLEFHGMEPSGGHLIAIFFKVSSYSSASRFEITSLQGS
eukprot:GHVT01071726.1.p1 GENE.GHVT01071726.1~~GHVT01071726.1.p1  ORF type:complete len:115 (+),score=1.75 GHVT01071726.1:839-1183(+)